MYEVITDRTPAELGYRMPAEWESHTAIWLQWPCRYPHASGQRDYSYQMQLEKTWLLMCWEIHRYAKVCILAQNKSQRDHIDAVMHYFGFDMQQLDIHVTSVIDVWHRDTGPIFVTDENGNIAVTDWNFNGWGSYPEWGQAEAHVARTVAEILQVPCFRSPLVSEGGAIEVNGSGSLLATRSSIINDNRNPGKTQLEVEQSLSDYLGVNHFIWLSGAPAEVCELELGDGTDYHVDIAARFAGQDKILYAWTDDQSDPRYPYLVRHRQELQDATNENGKSLTLIPVQLPEGGVYAIGNRYDSALGSGSNFTDASYLNYLVTNDIVLIPAFGNACDIDAQSNLASCFPERKIIPIPVVSLTAEGGAIHCVTQQQPTARKVESNPPVSIDPQLENHHPHPV